MASNRVYLFKMIIGSIVLLVLILAIKYQSVSTPIFADMVTTSFKWLVNVLNRAISPFLQK